MTFWFYFFFEKCIQRMPSKSKMVKCNYFVSVCLVYLIRDVHTFQWDKYSLSVFNYGCTHMGTQIVFIDIITVMLLQLAVSSKRRNQYMEVSHDDVANTILFDSYLPRYNVGIALIVIWIRQIKRPIFPLANQT